MDKNILLAILIFVVCSVNGCKNKSNTDTQINKLTKLELAQRIVDFGKVSTDTLLVAEYNFVNAGSHSLDIEYIDPDCTCTGYKLSSKQVAPQEQGTIQLVFNTKDRIGQQEIFAIEIAETGSPDLKRSMLNLEQFQKNLEAQRAALKSRFSLDVSPAGFSRNRRFDNRVSQWYTNENFQTNALFRVEQPILLTGGTLSLTNEFGWQSSFSDATDTESEVFYNNLYLNFNQPLFTYNRQKLELKELELSFENANISYALQRLNLERNVTEFFYNVYMAQMNLNIAKEELANTRKSYEINLKRYENSDLTGMDLNLYQTQLSERKIAYTQALINYKIELLNLKIQSLYDFEKNGPVLPAELYLKNSR